MDKPSTEVIERPPEAGTMKPDPVAAHVFKFLSQRQLLRCRLVRRSWNLAAISVLRERQTSIPLRLCYPYDGPCTRLGDTIARSLGKWDLPFVGLDVQYCRDENSDCDEWISQLTSGQKKFFQSYGPLFTVLVLNSTVAYEGGRIRIISWPPAPILQKLLSDCLPNLESIVILKEPPSLDTEYAYTEQIVPSTESALTRVQKLTLGTLIYRTWFVEKLVAAIPTITEIIILPDSGCSGLETVAKADRVHLVTQMRLCEFCEDPQVYQKLMKSPPKLIKLEVRSCEDHNDEELWDLEQNWASDEDEDGTKTPPREPTNLPAYAEALSAILLASKDSLRTLSIDAAIPIPLTNLPKMENLTTLEIFPAQSRSAPLFPFDDPAEFFPRLQTVKIQGCCTSFGIESLWSAPTPFVKQLEMDTSLNVEQMNYLASLFPNLICLRAQVSKDKLPPGLLHNFWRRVSTFTVDHLLLYNLSASELLLRENQLSDWARDFQCDDDGGNFQLPTGLGRVTIACNKDWSPVSTKQRECGCLARTLAAVALRGVDICVFYNFGCMQSSRVVEALIPYASKFSCDFDEK